MQTLYKKRSRLSQQTNTGSSKIYISIIKSELLVSKYLKEFPAAFLLEKRFPLTI
jgi:hypothetical protein